MGQVSPYLRRVANGYTHYCPGCDEAHILPDGWEFNGDVNKPTFSPSFKHEGGRFRRTTGESELFVCHYVLTDGILNYCPDSSHTLRGPVPLPELPDWMRDP